MDTNKLSDVLEMALNKTYVATTGDLPINTGMCNALVTLRVQGHISRIEYDIAQDYVRDFMAEMGEVSGQDTLFLYESLAPFKGYNTVDLQYLVWETIIDKLRSQEMSYSYIKHKM